MSSAFWTAARDCMMLDPTTINLNTGSFGPLPRAVFERVTACCAQDLAPEPMDFLVRAVPPLLQTAREALAQYLSADARRLVFTVNVTAAVNLVSSSLRLASPGEILLTDHEYGAMPLEPAGCRRPTAGTDVAHIPIADTGPPSPQEIVDAACRAMNARTRLFSFSHVLSPTGMNPSGPPACALEARRRGVRDRRVDAAAHAPAFPPLNLEEVNVRLLRLDHRHKWLLAPTGSGPFHLGPVHGGIRVQPLQVELGLDAPTPARAWMIQTNTAPDSAAAVAGARGDAHDICPWLSVPTALIQFQDEIGVERIRERIGELTGYVRRVG